MRHGGGLFGPAKVFAIGAVAAVCWMAAAQAEPIKLRVGTQILIDAAPFEAAQSLGYFKDEGLDVEATPMAGGSAALPALASGSVDIAASNTISLVLSVVQGFDFKIIAAGDTTRDDTPDLAGLVAKPDAGIAGCKDLEGKRLAVNLRKDGIWLYARGCIAANGGDPDKVTYVEVPFSQMVDAVRRGRVDAAFIVEPFMSSGVEGGDMKVVAWPYNKVLPRAPIMQWVATKRFIDAHGDTIERFARAYDKGADWVTANAGSPALAALIAGYTRIKPEVMAHVGSPAFPTSVDVVQIGKVIQLMQHQGLIKEGAAPKPEDLVYKTALPHAR